jgi:hypothetical protein
VVNASAKPVGLPYLEAEAIVMSVLMVITVPIVRLVLSADLTAPVIKPSPVTVNVSAKPVGLASEMEAIVMSAFLNITELAAPPVLSADLTALVIKPSPETVNVSAKPVGLALQEETVARVPLDTMVQTAVPALIVVLTEPAIKPSLAMVNVSAKPVGPALEMEGIVMFVPMITTVLIVLSVLIAAPMALVTKD